MKRTIVMLLLALSVLSLAAAAVSWYVDRRTDPPALKALDLEVDRLRLELDAAGREGRDEDAARLRGELRDANRRRTDLLRGMSPTDRPRVNPVP